jgi:hypothetical protein
MHALLDTGHALVQANPKSTFELRNGPALAQPKVLMFELGSRKLKNFTFVKSYIKALLELELSLI